jgi:hypothetical protein
MAITYDNITTTTLGSNSSSITISGVPNTYTDLKLIYVGANNDTPWLSLQFSNDTVDNYSSTSIYGDGSSVGNFQESGSTSMRIGYPLNSTTPSLVELDIFSYTSSGYKTVLSRLSNNLNGSGHSWRNVGLWRNSSSVSSIKLLAPGGSLFYAGATVTLYGIKNA